MIQMKQRGIAFNLQPVHLTTSLFCSCIVESEGNKLLVGEFEMRACVISELDVELLANET